MFDTLSSTLPAATIGCPLTTLYSYSSTAVRRGRATGVVGVVGEGGGGGGALVVVVVGVVGVGLGELVVVAGWCVLGRWRRGVQTLCRWRPCPTRWQTTRPWCVAPSAAPVPSIAAAPVAPRQSAASPAVHRRLI
jgi:hypothetical protein